MKKNIATILLLTCFISLGLHAQKPYNGQVVGEKVPLYCGSTGSSSADSTRLPILFQAKIQGLTPGVSYKYFARFISLADTASSTTTGYGIPVIMKKNGSWFSLSSPDLNTAGAHDTFFMPLGLGEYSGWFGAIYTDDSRFAPGKFVYPMIVFEEIGTGAPATQKVYLTDSIEVLQFSSSQSSGKGSAVYGTSGVRPKSMVLLYDNINGTTNRPVTVAYSENEGLSFSSMQNWYNTKINGSSGSWGSILPNTLSGGITRIESRDPVMDTIIYANTESDGIWGGDSTMNRWGGAKKPTFIKIDYAPLVKPEFEFVGNLSTVTESNTTVSMLVRRRYGNNDSSKVSAFVVAGTATNGVDYNILTGFPLRFKPYGEVIDTIKVKINDDFSSEPTENVAIRLNNPVNAKVGFQTTYSININDNDIPVIKFASKSASIKENHGLLKVKLIMNTGSTTATNVKVAVKSKTDSTFIPADFKIGSSNSDTTVQFPGGKINDTLEFNINIINDIVKEDRADTLVLVLKTPTSPATIGADSLFTLIIEDDDAPPVYNFSISKKTVKENVGSVQLRINKKGGNSNQSDIILSWDADSKNAQAGSDFTFSSQLLVFTSSDPDSLIYTVPIINDGLSELKEDAVFVLRTSFNSKIGKPDTMRVTILDDDLPEYKINKVNAGKSPNYVTDSINVHCAIRGLVYGINMGPVGSTNGLSFTVMDNTGGIQVFKASGGNKGYTVTEGDSVLVYGRIAQSNGMAQMTQIDTIFKLGSGRPLRTAKVVTFLDETTESNLIKYNLVRLADPSKWPSSALAQNTSVTLKVLTQNDSFNMIIDSETDIDGKTAPSGYFNVTGIGAQNDPSNPYSSGYNMFPRRFTDITNLVVPVFSITTTGSSTLETKDSTVGFTLQCANLTSNQQVTLFIKGGTASRGIDYQSNASKLYILTAAKPSILVKTKLKDDALIEANETITWVIRDNSWGTLIGADSVHSETIIDDESNSINETALAQKTKLFPNPAKDKLNIASEEAYIQKVDIIDVSGKIVASFMADNVLSTELAIEGLSKGIYTVSILTDQGTVVKSLSIL